jgi:hypothetical protein
LYADPDPDPTAQINADPCGSGYGSGSETLLYYMHCIVIHTSGCKSQMVIKALAAV